MNCVLDIISNGREIIASKAERSGWFFEFNYYDLLDAAVAV